MHYAPAPEVISTIGRVIADSQGLAEPALLLGNGFSIAFSRTFDYPSLLGLSTFNGIGINKDRLLANLQTADVESMIRSLEIAALVLSAYDADVESTRKLRLSPRFLRTLARTVRLDSERFPQCLFNAIHNITPSFESEFPYACRQACASWLRPFRYVFTLNYDLLLPQVVAVAQDLFGDETNLHEGRSKSRSPKYDEQPFYWNKEYLPGGERIHKQSVYYLHGAFHLLDSLDQFRNAHWQKDHLYLMLHARPGVEFSADVLHYSKAESISPAVILESTHDKKLNGIVSNHYLRSSLNTLRSISNTIIIFGCSLAENDSHIVDAVNQSGAKRIYYGIFRGRSTRQEWDDYIQSEFERVQQLFPEKELRLWQTDSSNPWGRDWVNVALAEKTQLRIARPLRRFQRPVYPRTATLFG